MASPADLELPPSRRMRFGYPMALLVLFLTLVLVFLAWSHMRQRELGLAAEQFRAQAERQAALVDLHLNNVELTLRGGASLLTTLDRPSPAYWRGYVAGLHLPTRFPSLLGLGYAAYVDPTGLVRLQEAWREQGDGLLQIRPHGLRDHYAVVLFLEPDIGANHSAVAFDMWSEPTRRAALQASMDSGTARLSASLVLMRDSGKPQRSMVFFTPVFATVDVPADPQSRREALRGWVIAPFHFETFLQGSLESGRNPMLLRIVDITDERPVVLHEDPGINAEHAFTHSLEKSLYGRQWRFDYFSGPQNTAAPQLAGVNRLLFLGLAVSLLLFGLTWTLASTEARARRLAANMTESSRRNEQRFRNAMQYSAIGKALMDSDGGILEWNPAFARIVGRPAQTLLRMRLNDLLGEDSEPVKTSQMQVFDEEGGIIRLTRSIRRGDGELRHVNLTFAPVPREPGSDVSRLVQVEDVTERTHAEAAVQALNRTLEARVASRTRELSDANRELESFAYSVSHDLRAPLRGIEGFSRLLEERHAHALDATGRDYLARVRGGTARMGELIEALLKLSRIRRSDPEFAAVDVTALAGDVAAELALAHPEHPVAVRIQPGMRASHADPTLLRNLLDNLLGNAWKFTRGTPDARVEMRSWRDDHGEVWFEVGDNGAGFDAAFADKLFQPFQRLHRQEDFAGHGIGLATVKRIVERHGGRIHAEGAVDGGARFRFTLGDEDDDAGTDLGEPG
ncbi:hypothetical protein MASR1M8_13510 [Thermomonas brevis]